MTKYVLNQDLLDKNVLVYPNTENIIILENVL